LDPVTEAIAAYEAAVDGIRRTGITKDMPNESVGRVFALGFVLEQFQRNLGDLLSRTREAQSAGPGPQGDSKKGYSGVTRLSC
jgi:hypothetical protein